MERADAANTARSGATNVSSSRDGYSRSASASTRCARSPFRLNARRILNRPRLVWTRRHPARAADASEEASGSWFARARVRGRGRVLSRVRVARLTSWSHRTRARPSRRGARRAPTWRRARASSRSWTREGALVATGKCGPARRPSARARAARARRSPPRPPRDADPREARGCARWEGRPRAPRRVRRARVERSAAASHARSYFRARSAFGEIRAGARSRNGRPEADRSIEIGSLRSVWPGPRGSRMRNTRGLARTSGRGADRRPSPPPASPRLASPSTRARSLARIPDPFLGSRLSREASRSSRRRGSSSVPTSKGLESTR